ncbi:MAG: pyridoxal phosphate-dependent aminotransferase [Oscillospiraceae bacterium]|nr:pyridoxal phosphate-dependent aminotransferase [Oscillospiraceae bacterium]
MLRKNSLDWGMSKSCIRELAAFGAQRKAEIGVENVFDFSLGNPSVPAPKCVDEALLEVIKSTPSTELHGYTPAAGLPSLRKAIAENLNSRWNTSLSAENIYVCCGAAAGITACTGGLMNSGEQLIAFAPYFPEYRVFTESGGGEFVSVASKADMQPDFEAFEKAINEKTGMVIINSPNNPSGAVLSDKSLKTLAEIMDKAQRKFGKPIYLLSDEPYRELVYEGERVPCVFDYYDNSIVCYSFSKALSLPGERIGYVAVNPKMQDADKAFAAVAGAARGYGYVNPPSLMQRVVEKCLGQTSDISQYKKNRDLLYGGLTKLGFECVKPEGAFYLMLKCPINDAKEFSDRAKKYELLLVPGDDFGIEGYVLLAYCVSEETIKNSMPAVEKLAKEFGLI